MREFSGIEVIALASCLFALAMACFQLGRLHEQVIAPRRKPRRVTLDAKLIHEAMHKAGMDVGLEDKDTFRILSNARAWTSWVSSHRPAAAAFNAALDRILNEKGE